MTPPPLPATHVYVASVPCGCVAAMCLDMPEYAPDIAEFVRDGYIVTRMLKGDESWHRCVKHMSHGHNEWVGAIDDQLEAAVAARGAK